jgi:hypothetical protein
VGQAGFLHDLRDTDPGHAGAADRAGGGIEDALVGLLMACGPDGSHDVD